MSNHNFKMLKIMSANVLFCHKNSKTWRYSVYTDMTYEKQQILSCKKLELENVQYFFYNVFL